MSTPLSYAEPEPFRSKRNPVTHVSLLLGRGLFLFLGGFVLYALIVGIGFAIGGYVGIAYLSCALLLVVVAASHARVALHRRRLAAVFTTCARAIEAGLPLHEFLLAAAGTDTGVLRKRLNRIARELATGASLDRALGESLPEMDRRQAGLLLSAASTGSLRPTLDRLAAECSPPPDEAERPRPSLHAYAGWVMGLSGIVCVMITIFVLPKFSQVLKDFGAPPDRTLETLLPLYGILTLMGAALVLHSLFSSLNRLTARRNTGAAPPPLKYLCLPAVLDRYLPSPARDRALADLYHMAAEALAAGRPLDEVLTWASTHPGQRSPANRAASRAASRAHDLLASLTAGADFAPAARASGLPPEDVAVLGIARGPDALADAFRFLAERRDRAWSLTDHKLAAVSSMLLLALMSAFTIPLIIAIWRPMLAILALTLDQATRTRW